MWPLGFSGETFDEAVDYFLARIPMTRDEYDALTESAKKKAFFVSGVAQMDVVTDVWRALDKALVEGTTLDEFRADVSSKLRKAWAGSVDAPAWRIETIFRTNVQVAYAAGRVQQATDPDNLDGRPYWMFDAVLDPRTTKVCRECDGTILPADDPWWKTHQPPLHFNCRSTFLTLTREQAEARGVTPKAPAAEADKGFGKPPGEDDWAPDPAKYPPELSKILEAKGEPPPERPKEHTTEHWEKEYEAFGVAAKPLAHGRAAMERGLAVDVDAAGKRLAAIDHPTVDRARTYLARARADLPKDATLADVAAWAKTNIEARDAESVVRVAAALAGHAASITPAKTLGFPTPRGAAAALKSEIAKATGLLRTLTAESAVTQKVGLRAITTDRALFNVSTFTIVIDKQDEAWTICHEFGHALESMATDAGVRAATFLEVRTEGDTERALNDILGRVVYGAKERAKPDRFRKAYVGKSYVTSTGVRVATEITSMGLQWLLTPEAATFFEEDPEHFWFVLGVLAGLP